MQSMQILKMCPYKKGEGGGESEPSNLETCLLPECSVLIRAQSPLFFKELFFSLRTRVCARAHVSKLSLSSSTTYIQEEWTGNASLHLGNRGAAANHFPLVLRVWEKALFWAAAFLSIHAIKLIRCMHVLFSSYGFLLQQLIKAVRSNKSTWNTCQKLSS